MKIQNIAYCNLNKPPSNKPKNLAFKPLQNDAFVKSKSVSFTSNLKNLEIKYNQFRPEITDYILNSKDIKLSEIEKIVQKVSPSTTVENMSEVPKDSNVSPATIAYFSQKIYFTNKGMMEDPKIIFLNTAGATTQEQKLELLGQIIHETTHILQEESPDRKGKVSSLNSYLKGKKLEKCVDTLRFMPIALSLVEQNMLEPLCNHLRKINNLPKPIPESSFRVLDDIYKKQTTYNVSEYLDNLIFSVMHYCKQNSNQTLDEKTIRNYIKLVASKEKEAYAKELKVQKEVLGIKGSSDLDLRVLLYGVLENSV